MKKPIAEFVGTFTLVFFGCGAAVIAGMGTGPTAIDVLGIAFAFGLAIVAMAYGIGPVSGGHVNPAVSFGVLLAGRMSASDFIGYVIAQVLGAIAGAAVLILSCRARHRAGPADSARTAGARAISANTVCCRRSYSRSWPRSCSWSASWA
jgi:glycerol uptake facilitator-like aquaporin